MKIKTVCFLLAAIGIISCSDEPKSAAPIVQPNPVPEEKFVPLAPPFNEDSAYSFVKTQVEFGPRVPGTKEHARCAEYLFGKLKQYGFEVQIQSAKVKTFDDKEFTLKNIIGSYKADMQKRILLCAHWDTRPFADSDIKDRNRPPDGADDGASGVAVLLEIARQISIMGIETGIDIIFFDIEDYGQPSNAMPEKEDTWCIGSQYWGMNLHKKGYKADFGILLDMVGARGSVFPREGTSLHYAPGVVEKVWGIAAKMGYSGKFINDTTGETTDDHLYINKLASIPTIDIVYMNPQTGGYGPHHHTHADNLSVIDSNSLKIVGQTVMEVIVRH